MDYISIAIAGALGAVGGGLGYWIFSKIFKDKMVHSIGGMVMAILFYQTLHPIIYDKGISVNKTMVMPKNINKMLKEIERANSPLLPRMVDDVTRQDSIEATTLRLKYGYTIIDSKMDIKFLEEHLDEVKRSIQRNSCQDKTIKMLIDNQVILEFSYKVENMPNRLSFELTSCP